MNDENIDNDDTNENPESLESDDAGAAEARPLGYWLRTVDAYLAREFARLFEDEGVSRREWMLLNVVAGDVKAPGFAERIARKGKRLRGLEERGWVEESGDGSWILTEEGRAAKERLAALVDGLRSRVAGAVPAEDFATTLASLEAIARELGWDEDERAPWMGFGRGFGRGFGPGAGWGFGPGAGRGFGPGFGPRPFGHDIHRDFGPNLHRGFRPGFGPGGGPTGMPSDPEDSAHHEAHHAHHAHGGCHGQEGRYGYGHRHSHGHHDHHGHDHHGHDQHGHGAEQDVESAYERGFEAGFTRGRTAS